MLYKEYTKNLVSLPRLWQEIDSSSITIAPDKSLTTVFGTTLTLYFKDDLSSEEWTICDTIVSNHTGESLVPEPSSVSVVAQPPFAAKVLFDGSKLFKRKHGFSITIPANSSYEEKFNCI